MSDPDDTPARGVLAIDRRQDRWIAVVAFVAVGAALGVAYVARAQHAPAPASSVHVACPPAPACPPSPPCAACPACPQPMERRHR